MNTNTKAILGSMICIALDIHVWGGRRKLKPTDLKIQDGEIPPPDLASLGSLKVCDPDALTAFDTLRKRAQRICLEHGVRFMGGYAVPRDSFAVLAKELDQVVADFDKSKRAFLDDYDASIEAWITAHPDWETIVRRSVVPVDKVALAFSFGWMPIPIENSRSTAISSRIAAKTQGLAGRLYEEVAAEAQKIADKLLGQSKITQNSLNGVRRLRRKLDGLQFLDQTISPVTTLIDAALSALPPAGPIDGAGVASVHGLLYLMSDPNRMIDHGKRIVAGESADSLAANLGGSGATTKQTTFDLAVQVTTAGQDQMFVEPESASQPEHVADVQTDASATAEEEEGAQTATEVDAAGATASDDDDVPEVSPVIYPPASTGSRNISLAF